MNNSYVLKKVIFNRYKGLEKISDENGCFIFEPKLGLNLISGENGTGKSTILNNLSPFIESLDNTTLKPSFYISSGGGKEVFFSLNNTDYKSVIKLSEDDSTKAWLYNKIADDWIIIPGFESGKQTTYKDKIEGLLNISADRVSKTLHIKQNSDFIITAKPKDRLELIQELMPDTKNMDEQFNIFKEKEISAKNKVSNLNGSTEVLEKQLEQVSKLESEETILLKNEVLNKIKRDVNPFLDNNEKLTQEKNELIGSLNILISSDPITPIMNGKDYLTNYREIELNDIKTEFNDFSVEENQNRIDELNEVKSKIQVLQKEASFTRSVESYIDINPLKLDFEKMSLLNKENQDFNLKVNKLKDISETILLKKESFLSFSSKSPFSNIDDFRSFVSSFKTYENEKKDFLKIVNDWEKLINDNAIIEKHNLETFNILKSFFIENGDFNSKDISKDNNDIVIKSMKNTLSNIDNISFNNSTNLDKDNLDKNITIIDYNNAIEKLSFDTFGFESFSYAEELLNKILVLEKDIDRLEHSYNTIYSELNLKNTDINSIDLKETFVDNLKELDKKITSISNKNEVFNSEKRLFNQKLEAEKELKKLPSLENINKDIDLIKNKITDYKLFENKNKSNLIRTKFNNLIFKLKNNNDSIQENKNNALEFLSLQRTKENITSVSSELQEIDNLINSNSILLEKIKNRDKLTKELEEYSLLLKKEKSSTRVFNKIKIAISKVKESLASNFMTTLTEQANDYISSDEQSSIKLELVIEQKGKSFIIFALQPNKEKQEISTLSGAEKSVVQRALSLALSNADKLNLYRIITLDEADSTLSESNKNSFIHSIDKINKMFPQTFIISHSEFVKNSFLTNSIIELQKIS